MDQTDRNDPLTTLDREIAPPAALEARVLQTLRSRGLLRGPRTTVTWGVALGLAAALALLAAGYLAGRSTTPDGMPPAEGRRYALFLYEDASFVRSMPEQELVAEYSAWAGSLGREGRLESGEKLATDGLILRLDRDSVRAAPGEVMSDAGALAGFFVIRAGSDAEAVTIAGTCPHVKYGGRIALRAIE